MIGQKIGPFLIQSELGAGAMGQVFLGIYEEKNRPVAIKVISSEQIGKGRAIERFKREAAILKQFRHPNIVRFIGEGKTRTGMVYYAMEYIKGPTLDKVLSKREQLPWREVATLGAQICDALQYAHEHGVVHRDLKPANLMLTEAGQIKLTDFGIAKDLDATALTGTGRTLGTATYMAPEQIRGTPEVSHKTDLYALGAVFYQMLTGFPPFTGSTAVVLMHAHINEPPRRPSAKIHEIPKALDDLVIQLMAKAPTDRPWDASAVAQTLRDLLDKDARQEPIKMVWPSPEETISTRNSTLVDDTSLAKKSGKSKKKKKVDDSTLREKLEPLALVAGLLIVGGLIGYIVWPPSAQYLFTQAEVLMKSSKSEDWSTARDKYLDPLDSRYPEHPYKEKTEEWRDKLDLEQVERRARLLERGNLSGLNNPGNETEILFRATFDNSSAAMKLKHDTEAELLWRGMVKELEPQGRPSRGWMLLAKKRADLLAREISERQKTVRELLNSSRIPDALLGSRTAHDSSEAILKDIIERFKGYSSVAVEVNQAEAALAASKAQSEPAPTPKPEENKPKSDKS